MIYQPSLPRRLRFNRQHSDLTPSKGWKDSGSSSMLLVEEKERKQANALDAANDDIKKKTDVIIDLSQQISQLQEDLQRLHKSTSDTDESISQKDAKIAELENKGNDLEKANSILKATCDESIEKINVLEFEIKTIVKDHDAEMNKLIQKNIYLDGKCEKLKNGNRLMSEKIEALKNDLETATHNVRTHKELLQCETEKLNEKDSEYRKLLDENIQLLEGIERIKKQADDDMLSYMSENRKLTAELDVIRQDKSKVITELYLKEELINALQEELGEKTVEMDAERDELKETMNAELNAIIKKYEQQMATLKEVNDIKVKEIESISVLERAQLIIEYKEMIASLKDANEEERVRQNESAEEKIRIAEIQSEQKLNALEATIEQSIQQEKYICKSEIEKCQKIAEREIMQCEFEKRDLKTLLESTNELLRERDEKIEDLRQQLTCVEVSNLIRSRDDLESKLNEMQRERGRMLSERYNYQIALNNTRSTVNILMGRLQKSDTDVELLKDELDAILQSKLEMENVNIKLVKELEYLTKEIEEYRLALTALRNSSLTLEREVLEKESVFEKIMTSEQETLETVNKIGKLFNDKLEENINKYAELYNDIKKKYDARETYIKDMKALLEEFATGIELARIELEMKDKQLSELQDENKNIKLEIMTYKFKCEQFERYAKEQRVPNPTPESIDERGDGKTLNLSDDEGMVSNQLIENIIVQLEKEAESENFAAEFNTEMYSDEDKISAENLYLKEKLSEKMRQIDFLQEMVEIENGHAAENFALRHQINEFEQKIVSIEKFANETVDKYSDLVKHQLKETNLHLKNVSIPIYFILC